jgi:hypothetical protein
MASKRKGFSWIALLAALGLLMGACGGDDDGGTAEEGTESPAGDGGGSIWVLLPDTESSDRWKKTTGGTSRRTSRPTALSKARTSRS